MSQVIQWHLDLSGLVGGLFVSHKTAFVRNKKSTIPQEYTVNTGPLSDLHRKCCCWLRVLVQCIMLYNALQNSTSVEPSLLSNQNQL